MTTTQQVTNISVVIPAYNAEQFLARAIYSVKKQKGWNEIIVVNDASTDNTVDIAKSFGVRVITNKFNEGIGSTRQKGAQEAKGDYVAYLSADDAYSPDFFKSLPALNGKNAVFTNYYRCNDNLKPVSIFEAPRYLSDAEFRKLVIQWTLKRNLFVNFSTVVIPKSVFTKVQFRAELRRSEDIIFLLESVIKNVKWLHIPRPLCYYRISHVKLTYENWFFVWEKSTPLLKKLGVSNQEIKEAITVNYRECFPLPHKRLLAKIMRTLRK